MKYGGIRVDIFGTGTYKVRIPLLACACDLSQSMSFL
jgi:hypothetical protein